MGLVCESPQRYPVEMRPDVRRIQMARFPYTILYRDVQALFKYWRLLIIAGVHNIGWEGSNYALKPSPKSGAA